jgi:hypothetical protein
MPAGVIDNGGDEPCLNLKSFLPDMPTGGRHYHDAICTGDGDDDVKCGGGGGMEAIEVVGVVSEMRKAVVFRSRYENGIASDRGGIGEARAGDHAGGDSYVAAAPWLRLNIYLYLPEYRGRRKHLPGMKAWKGAPTQHSRRGVPYPTKVEPHQHLCLTICEAQGSYFSKTTRFRPLRGS